MLSENGSPSDVRSTGWITPSRRGAVICWMFAELTCRPPLLRSETVTLPTYASITRPISPSLTELLARC